MSPAEIAVMRKQQIILLNVGFLGVSLFTIILALIEVPLKYFILVVGILSLIQGFRGLVKRNSTKSWFPLIEKIQTYEQEKLGNERKKYNVMHSILQLLIGVMFTLQSIFLIDTDMLFETWMVGFVVLLIFLIAIVANVSQYVHMKKVDQAAISELKGYASKNMLIGLILGVGLGYLIIMGVILYVFTVEM